MAITTQNLFLMRIFLIIPQKDIQEAKDFGVSYDLFRRSWFVLDSHANKDAIIKKWNVSQNNASSIENLMFTNEDRSFGQGLFVDLIPQSCWMSNVRSSITDSDWQRVRKVVVGRAGNHCEICGVSPNNHARLFMEVHERWHYYQEGSQHIQKLKRLICLCSKCHMVTHIGFANVRGKAEEVIAHLMKVKSIPRNVAMQEINEAYALWNERNRVKWSLDISLITDAGISVRRKSP